MQNILFLLLSVPSHIFASLFFAKPRYNKVVTAIIWVGYGIFFLMLPLTFPLLNFFITLVLHFVLFFVTSTGRAVEKGFLFFSYATAYTCFCTLFNMVNQQLHNQVAQTLLAIGLMAIMQLILYLLLLPAFRKMAKYIRKGWRKFYVIIISFWLLLVGQSSFTMMAPMSVEESIVFLISAVAFCATYIAMFSSMKDTVELSREKQKTLHTELLQAQVDAQAKEAELVRQNRHDLRFHYQALLSMAHNGETEKIIEYLNFQNDYLESRTTGRFCENETVNNILNVFQKKAAEANIAIEIRAAAKPDISVPAPALVTVVANILESALNGALESKAPQPTIQVSIKHKADRLVIPCENTCLASLNFEEMPEHLQGTGIRSVISTAENYNGSCRFSASDGVFRCTVIMDEEASPPHPRRGFFMPVGGAFVMETEPLFHDKITVFHDISVSPESIRGIINL